MHPKKGGRKYAMKDKKNKDVYLQVITMIDSANDWREIFLLPEAKADSVANQEQIF